MTVLRIATFAILSVLSTSLGFSYDLEKMTTKMGKTYHEIQIISSDKHGLMFRHSKGVAKENFSQLSTAIQEMFKPVNQVPKAGKGDLPNDKGGATNSSGKQMIALDDVVLTLRTTTTFSNPVYYQQLQQQHCNQWCAKNHINPTNWPSQWHRFNRAHYLTNPICRQRATNQLLHATGLLPRSCGLVTHPHHFARPAAGFRYYH